MKKKDIKDTKLLIFDWSGTISDDRKAVQTAFNRVAIEIGLKPIEDLRSWLKKSVREFENQYSEQLYKTKSPEEIRQLYFRHFSTLREEGIKPTVYKDALEALTTMKNKGKKLIVVSHHPHKSLVEEAEEYGLTKHFDEILGSIPVKTDEIIKVCKDMMIDVEKAVYVGDMVNDIKSAKKAKVISVALTQGYHDKKTLLREKPDYLLRKLSDLVNLL
ncbi:MAG: HAD family hydrolase [Candidatus Levyibacteriota bacterium]